MYYTYILTTKNNTALYVGVTNDLNRRMIEHKSEIIIGFTRKYHIHKLVYYEIFHDPNVAIAREKQLKGWRREKKIALIEKTNPDWQDLSLLYDQQR